MPHPGLLHPEPLPPWQATADPYLRRRHLKTQRQVWLSLCSVWCAKGFVWVLWVSLADMGFDSKCNFTLLPSCCGFSFSLGHGVWFWWDPTFFCWWLFSYEHNFGILEREDEQKSFYSAILILVKKCLYKYKNCCILLVKIIGPIITSPKRSIELNRSITK